MSISIARIRAIVIKELQDLRTNLNILYMYAIPVVLVFLYQQVIPGLPGSFTVGFGLLFLVAMVGMYVPAMMIAEEKEKKTLEVLMLSPATPGEVFIGKGLITFLSIHAVLFVVLWAAGTKLLHLDVILVGTVLTSIVCIALGMVVGLLVETQMQTGVIGTPIYMLLMLVPLLSDFVETGPIAVLARALPTFYFFEMIHLAFEQNHALRELHLHVGMLAASAAVSLVALLLVYRRRGFQE